MENKQKLTNEKKLPKIHYLILFLLIYAFLGWILETAYAFYETGTFVKRGFLYGPLCPIYGWGAIILFGFLGKYKNNSLKMFFISAIVFSVFEYFVSFGMEALFSAKWWDYSDKVLNLNGRISIFFSFVWGIFEVLFINHIHPFIKKKIDKLLNSTPYNLKLNFIRILCLAYILDTILSMFRYFSNN